jgi:hypothetical protein
LTRRFLPFRVAWPDGIKPPVSEQHDGAPPLFTLRAIENIGGVSTLWLFDQGKFLRLIVKEHRRVRGLGCLRPHYRAALHTLIELGQVKALKRLNGGRHINSGFHFEYFEYLLPQPPATEIEIEIAFEFEYEIEPRTEVEPRL